MQDSFQDTPHVGGAYLWITHMNLWGCLRLFCGFTFDNLTKHLLPINLNHYFWCWKCLGPFIIIPLTEGAFCQKALLTVWQLYAICCSAVMKQKHYSHWVAKNLPPLGCDWIGTSWWTKTPFFKRTQLVWVTLVSSEVKVLPVSTLFCVVC